MSADHRETGTPSAPGGCHTTMGSIPNCFTESSIRLALSKVALFLIPLASPTVVSSQSQCDYAAWVAANPQYSGVDRPMPEDSLDQLPIPTAWPDSPEKHALAEIARTGWTWDATMRIVVDTNGAVLEAEVLHLDVWLDGAVGDRRTVAALDKLAAVDTLEALLGGFLGNMEFTPGVRKGVPVPAFMCPNMSAAMMQPELPDAMGFTVIGPSFFAIQVCPTRQQTNSRT